MCSCRLLNADVGGLCLFWRWGASEGLPQDQGKSVAPGGAGVHCIHPVGVRCEPVSEVVGEKCATQSERLDWGQLVARTGDEVGHLPEGVEVSNVVDCVVRKVSRYLRGK